MFFLQLEHMLMEQIWQMSEHSATEADGRMKNLTFVSCDTYLILHVYLLTCAKPLLL